MGTPTRSPTPCASQSRHCANASANPGSSPPWPASDTASALKPTPGGREESVDRAPGLSVRLKLTLSYAGFLMLAGALLLAAVWVFLLRYVPDRVPRARRRLRRHARAARRSKPRQRRACRPPPPHSELAHAPELVSAQSE